MIPIVTPAEMAAIDAAAPEPLDVLIDRAARAVVRTAVEMMGGTYGRRVVIVAGPGNNGADGRRAAVLLTRRGVRTVVVEPEVIAIPSGADLVIDAAFGTGLRRPYRFPDGAGDVPVLAVDIPSGVDGLTGEILGAPTAADRTITFAALKPGLVLEPGRSLAGAVDVADIGLDVSGSMCDVVEGADVAAWLPVRAADVHKWHQAVRVVGGSEPMTGAPRLAARAAQRMGAGYVQLAIPGRVGVEEPLEVVGHPLPATGWGDAAVVDAERLAALVIGPGLGVGHGSDLATALTVDRPLVIDGDALRPELVEVVAARRSATVLTPHGGEFARLGGSSTVDPIAGTRALAARTGAVVAHKGPTTIVADPDGPVLVIANGGPALATAGTGDVLAGAIGALLAQGIDPLHAAAAAAWIHAEAGRGVVGLVASDLPDRMAGLLGDG